jgi:DNA-binding response OmpR family regulator
MRNRKILVIEDDPDVRLGYNVLLRAHNYDTFFAVDSLSAISEARKQQPDLILLDLGLPAGDGFIVLERLRGLTQLALIPVIVVSARDPHANRERALKAGAKAFVQKPWDDSELLAMIAELLGERESPLSQPR